ncbi:MAG: aminotransferase class V-fold PLP-dependent enzyme [Bacteroidetes bacterium]|nr:aminotransferase class V-fold PLP-dependent enzyme [Bacteroidota bacterium]
MNIYLDNAATTALDPRVLDAMMPYMTQRYGNPSSIHAFGRETRAAIERARKTIADCLHASMGELFFTSGGTESNNTALQCAVRDLGVQTIISSALEHHCVEATAHSLEAAGKVALHLVDVDAQGHIDADHLESLLAQHPGPTTLVSLMHANNEIGTLLDLEATGLLCQRYGALFHSDTVQTVGHYPMNLSRLPVDFISGAGHKFHGPKGIGLLYINNKRHLQPLIHGGAQERNMRAGTENVYGIIGLAKALELATAEMETNRKTIDGIRHYMADSLRRRIPNVQFNGDWENGLYTVLNVHFPANGREDMLLFNLDIEGISASGGSACSSGSSIGSHVLRAIGAEQSGVSIRFSFCPHNTREEIDQTLDKLEAVYSSPRKAGTAPSFKR